MYSLIFRFVNIICIIRHFQPPARSKSSVTSCPSSCQYIYPQEGVAEGGEACKAKNTAESLTGAAARRCGRGWGDLKTGTLGEHAGTFLESRSGNVGRQGLRGLSNKSPPFFPTTRLLVPWKAESGGVAAAMGSLKRGWAWRMAPWGSWQAQVLRAVNMMAEWQGPLGAFKTSSSSPPPHSPMCQNKVGQIPTLLLLSNHFGTKAEAEHGLARRRPHGPCSDTSRIKGRCRTGNKFPRTGSRPHCIIH